MDGWMDGRMDGWMDELMLYQWKGGKMILVLLVQALYTCNLQTHFDPFFRNPLKPLLHTTQIWPLPTKLVLNVCWNNGKSVILKREGRSNIKGLWSSYYTCTYIPVLDLDLSILVGLCPSTGVDEPDSPLDIGDPIRCIFEMRGWELSFIPLRDLTGLFIPQRFLLTTKRSFSPTGLSSPDLMDK